MLLISEMEFLPGKVSVFAAEACAMLAGLSCCLQEGYRKVKVEIK